MTFVRTRKVEIVVMDGSLELPGAIAGQEYVRRMCIDPARGFARRDGARRLQEGDDIGLLFGLADRSCRRRHLDRKTVVSGRRVPVRVDLGGRSIFTKTLIKNTSTTM